MEYIDLVLSGKSVSLDIQSGDSAYNTLVRNGAKLRISAGGRVEITTVMNSTTISNAGSALSTFLSGGSMVLQSGGVADTVAVLRNARLTVSDGAVATGLYVSSGNVNAVVRGGDGTTLISGVNEKGEFFLSGGTASNFLMNSLGQLTVSSGGTAADTTVRFGGYLTVMSGARATGIDQRAGGYVRADVYGGDETTVACGVNASGSFSLSGGVASNFILYDGGAQQIFSGGTALNTHVSGLRAFQYVWSKGVTSDTSVFKNGVVNVYDGGIARNVTIASGGSMVTCDGGQVSGATVQGTLLIDSGSTGEGESGGLAAVRDVTVLSGGTLGINKKANFSGEITVCGTLKIASGVTISELTVSSTGSALVAGTFDVRESSWNTTASRGGTVNVSSGATLFNLATVSGARVNFAAGAVLAGTSFEIAESTVYCGGAALGMTAAGGEIRELGADGQAYHLTFGSGVTVAGAVVGNGGRLCALSGARISGARVSGGVLEVLDAGAVLADTTVAAGGSLLLVSGADTGKRLFFDYSDTLSGGAMTAMVNDFSLLSPETALCLVGTSDGGVYSVDPAGTSDLYVCCMPTRMYSGAIKAGERTVNAFIGMAHAFDAAGTSITASAFEVAAFDSAAALDDSATRIGNDRAAKWTNFSVSSGAVLTLAATSFDGGDAWLELDGTNLENTSLYGAAANLDFGGAVNLLATSGAALGNLAAGAAARGSVAGVKLTVDDATLGLAYAGGFGTVAGSVETLFAAGSATKDFYAGALANYAKTGKVTGAGDITMEIDDGRFDGNIYGAAAVKAGGATSLVHTAGDVTLTIRGGSATAGQKACIFAGGYATGSAASETAVYEVGDITVGISGGDWGTAAGGRGVFGGVFASLVTAEAGNVSLTVTGGEMGNLYGGGWAQKGGTSIVGNVNISISGGTIANVFGGGAHSMERNKGFTTVAGDITVTVAGGTISNAIYARGQLDGDEVTGNAEVIFTGAQDFAFNDGVYGYSYVGGAEASDATLTFSDYTGVFAGAVGGFAGTTLAGNTAMTLATAAADVSNGAWTFDVAERRAAFADTAMLNWAAAKFTDPNRPVVITLNLAAGNDTEWCLVNAAAGTNYDRFDVQVDEASILADTLGLGDVIADGDYAGWGFTVEDAVLKFKNLA